MPLVHSFGLGALRCHALEGGTQRLDGGAMFGVVPKPLWSRRIAADERNRIALAMRCLLIEHPDGLVLVDTALGNKEDPKFRDIYGIENAGPDGRTRLEAALAEAGFTPAEVTRVINTHLHFDHAGGNTFVDGRKDGKTEGGGAGTDRPSVVPAVRLSFPNATYLVQRGDLDFARRPNERTRASYLPHNFEPVAAAGKLELLDGDGEVVSGISVRLTPGHVPFHQSVLVRSGGEALCFLADVMPTRHHLPLPWIMGYDVEPLRTLESKRRLVKEALDRDWRLFFGHDHDVVMGRLAGNEKGVELVDAVPAPVAGSPEPAADLRK
ncbi:MAG TPA: MBL fold metallo-hydrolase [Gemmatimonadales bacterium]|jgi:glyoxylase-like metal-dependent hydrolase (beta-lactamase superfamily II)|nr:MBL fold metallo-hydrolase [Gemmatimonadales bacterium]